MQWSQIKTLFILCFLVLDVYLLFQFFDKQSEADIGVLERQDSPIEEQLEAENIKVPKLPEDVLDESFLSVKPKTFTEDELKKLEDFKNQEAIVLNSNFILSRFKDPVSLPSNGTKDKIDALVKKSILFSEEYKFWSWNKDMNVLIFFQEKAERPIYFNHNGMYLIFLIDDNEIIIYNHYL